MIEKQNFFDLKIKKLERRVYKSQALFLDGYYEEAIKKLDGILKDTKDFSKKNSVFSGEPILEKIVLVSEGIEMMVYGRMLEKLKNSNSYKEKSGRQKYLELYKKMEKIVRGPLPSMNSYALKLLEISIEWNKNGFLIEEKLKD